MDVTPTGDQSIFVRAAINGVLREAVIAACLTAAMILLFLGSWRSTLVVAVSIPDSDLTARNERLRRDHQHHDPGRPGAGRRHPRRRRHRRNRKYQSHCSPKACRARDDSDGAQQIAIPAFVATPVHLYRFVPMFF